MIGYIIIAFVIGFMAAMLVSSESDIASRERAKRTARQYAARQFYARNMSKLSRGERVEEAPAPYRW